MDAERIALDGLILRTTVGSSVHGVAIAGTDDRDEMGICIEPPTHVLGLSSFEHFIKRSKPDGVRSEPGDLDLVIYSLRKWTRLALKGNPSVIVPLFVPEEHIVYITPAGRELRALASAFASRAAAKPFLGYLMAQRQRLMGERGQLRVHRPELVDAYGFDTKYAGHVIRLGYQGVEYLSTGRITLPMPPRERFRVIDIREGRVPLNDVLTEAGELEARIRDLADASPLPPEPNTRAVEDFMLRAYTESWYWPGASATACASQWPSELMQRVEAYEPVIEIVPDTRTWWIKMLDWFKLQVQ